MPAISFQSISKAYVSPKGPPGSKFLAVDQVSLDIEQGEFFGLLGPNGAGKTTTIGILTGDMQPSSGSAFVNFSNISSNSRRDSIAVAVLLVGVLTVCWWCREGFKVMGFCPQFDALWPDMTGRLTLAAVLAS